MVLDATVGLKWHLNDEEYVDEALAIREDFIEDRLGLIAPDLLRHEVAAGILKATKNPQRPRRLDTNSARLTLTAFLARQVTYMNTGPLVAAAYEIAPRYGCSYYDGVYLALAESMGVALVHADEKLRRTLGDRFPLVLWIEDYRGSART